MSDLDDEINNATISFVPQIGPGADKKKKKASHEEQPQPQQQQQQPPAPMIGFQSFPPPPNPYAAQSPYYAAGPPMKQPMNGSGMMMFAPGQQQEMMFVGQPVMGMMPYPPTAPMSPYNAYPQAAAYAPGQPGAMVLLVQEMPDVDFQAPFCGCNSCIGCLNHTFLTYCQLARQQNMIEVLSQDPTALQVSANGCKTYVNEARAQQNVGRVKNVNGCCAFASVFDAVSLAVGFFFPQFGGSMCGTGLCIQTIQVRQQIRRRFGIMPHQIQDVCAGCCFPWCASQQQQQEFQLRMANCKLVCGDEMPVRPLRPMQ